MFEDLDQAVLGKILEEQRQLTEECRKRKVKPPQVCICLDDLADRGDILSKRNGGTSGGSWLVSLATRGRHFGGGDGGGEGGGGLGGGGNGGGDGGGGDGGGGAGGGEGDGGGGSGGGGEGGGVYARYESY